MSAVIQAEITTERAAMVVWMLVNGQTPSTAEVASILGMSRQGAHAHLSKIARVVPIVLDDGRWQLVQEVRNEA